MNLPKLRIICAMTSNNVIGINNTLPWSLPADMKFFRETTTGAPIVMGHNTYLSIGRPLPKRHNIVVTEKPVNYPGVQIVDNFEVALEIAKQVAIDTNQEYYYVIGGSQMYQQAINVADELIISHIDMVCEGDAFFPKIDEKIWKAVWQNEHLPDENNKHYVAFVKYIRSI